MYIYIYLAIYYTWFAMLTSMNPKFFSFQPNLVYTGIHFNFGKL